MLKNKWLIMISAFLVACGPGLQTVESKEASLQNSANQEDDYQTVPYEESQDSNNSNTGSSGLELITVKVRVYQLKFAGTSAYDSKFSSSTISDYVAGVNEIYQQAGIKLVLESVKTLTVPTSEISSISSSDSDQTLGDKLKRITFPSANIGQPLLQVAFFKSFTGGSKGVYLKTKKVAFVGEYAKNGSLNEPIVMAHELGHELSLPHSNESGTECVNDNLLCAGGTGIGENLTADQISEMRAQALIGPF